MSRQAVVADDDAAFRRMLARALEVADLEVIEVADGLELVDLLERAAAGEAERPSCIVADIQMPGCSGLRALASMRRLHLDIPTVLITAFGDEATHALAERLGAAAVFDKPFDLAEVRRCVVDLLGPPQDQ